MRVVLAMLLALMPLSAHAARADADARAVEIYRAGLEAAAAEMRALGSDRRELLSAEEKQRVRNTWSAFLDYLLALDSIGAYHREQKSEPSLVITYSAFLAQYRGALAMIDAAEKLPGADAVLNEDVAGIGLPAGSYARVKFRWLNVVRATEFAALDSLYRVRGGTSLPKLRALIDTDARAVLAAGRGKGPVQTARNALKIAGSTAFTAWFPVQKGVAEWMGDTRLARPERALVSHAQIAALVPRLQPGDVLLERREWYLSNVGLPGFWPHTALFVGDAASRARYFDDPEVKAWVRAQGRADGDFEAFLRERYPAAYARSRNTQIIEAISEGVSFTTIEHSAAADSLAVLRPRASKRDKARAIARAFGYVGRPYDFDFDFHTDSALVCSEVLYKAYEGSVTFPLSTTMSRLNTPPNEIVREFDATFGTDRQQFDLIAFLDGHERDRAARPAGVSEFRASWKRPKWHVVTQ
ncbi:MAG TPA: YiiX/YebB-like N1pC/P60 family cysteine hydrolase [Thermoanaerobaculia bacterium]|nr:YiiX/YebB-like N1pC/P60 family cysteine hydrolase [Thermoanaerobaculia bacterium]